MQPQPLGEEERVWGSGRYKYRITAEKKVNVFYLARPYGTHTEQPKRAAEPKARDCRETRRECAVRLFLIANI